MELPRHDLTRCNWATSLLQTLVPSSCGIAQTHSVAKDRPRRMPHRLQRSDMNRRLTAVAAWCPAIAFVALVVILRAGPGSPESDSPVRQRLVPALAADASVTAKLQPVAVVREEPAAVVQEEIASAVA